MHPGVFFHAFGYEEENDPFIVVIDHCCIRHAFILACLGCVLFTAHPQRIYALLIYGYYFTKIASHAAVGLR